jgi:hypothetical protein
VREKFPAGDLEFLGCVVSKDKKTKCRIMKTRKEVRVKYKTDYKTIKKSRQGRGCVS